MNVSDLMVRDVRSCRPTDSMNRATQIMWERDCGCVPVADPSGRVLGLITDRDVAMAAYTKDCCLSSVPVEQAMAKTVISCHPADSLDAVLHQMAENQIHRLPVVDQAERLVGMISLTDIVQATAHDDRTRRTWTQPVFATLFDVTRPRMAGRALQTQTPTAKERPANATA